MRFEDLNDFCVLYLSKSSAIRPRIARMLIARDVPLSDQRMETAPSSFGRATVLGDTGVVCFIGRGVIADDLATGRMVALDLDMLATLGAVGIIERAEVVPPTFARAFAGRVSEITKRMPELQLQNVMTFLKFDKSMRIYIALN